MLSRPTDQSQDPFLDGKPDAVTPSYITIQGAWSIVSSTILHPSCISIAITSIGHFDGFRQLENMKDAILILELIVYLVAV
jgi:hypothetical protein